MQYERDMRVQNRFTWLATKSVSRKSAIIVSRKFCICKKGLSLLYFECHSPPASLILLYMYIHYCCGLYEQSCWCTWRFAWSARFTITYQFIRMRSGCLHHIMILWRLVLFRVISESSLRAWNSYHLVQKKQGIMIHGILRVQVYSTCKKSI